MACLDKKFEVAPLNGLDGYIFTRNVMDGHTDGWTDGRWTNFGAKLMYPFFLKKRVGIIRGKVFQTNMSKNTVDGNCMT